MKLLDELAAYFAAKENRTEEEENFLKALKFQEGEFPISWVMREDVKANGFNGDAMTDEDMAQLADDMNDMYLNEGYWDDLRSSCEHRNIPELSRIVIVDWDCDDEEADLPKEVEVPMRISDDDVSDWLSDEYGWTVNSWVDAE